MKKELLEKFNEKSIEYSILDFLSRFSELKTPYAFTGGVAFGAYLGHLPRRLGDIDMVTSLKAFPKVKKFLLSLGFKETTKTSIIKEFRKERCYFDVDIHIDYLYLGNPPKWEILAKYPLKKSLAERIKLPIKSMDGKKSVSVYVVSPHSHFLKKLFPPIEPSNMHDLIYLVITARNFEKFSNNVYKLINNEKEFKEFFKERIKAYKSVIPKTIWFKSLNSKNKEKVLKLWQELL